MLRSARMAALVLAAGCGDDVATPATHVLALGLDTELRLLDLDGWSEPWTPNPAHVVEWSPDGRWLISISRDDGAVLLVDDADTRERVLTATCDWRTALAWSPDGTRLAFRTRDPANYLLGGISIFDTGTRRVRVLTPPTGNDMRPVWAPGGRRILFERGFSDPSYGAPSGEHVSKLLVADLETGALTRLTDTDAEIEETEARYSFDGRWLAFVVGPWFSSGRVWAHGPQGQRRLGSSPYHPYLGLLLPRPGASEFLYGVFGEGDGSARIVLLDPDRGTEVELDRTEFYPGWWEDAVWSPDGRQVAFEDSTGDCCIFGAEVHLYDVDRRERRLLAALPDTCEVMALAWSPGGDRLAALARDCYTHVDQDHPDWVAPASLVHVITVATGALERLHVEPRLPSYDLAWRP